MQSERRLEWSQSLRKVLYETIAKWHKGRRIILRRFWAGVPLAWTDSEAHELNIQQDYYGPLQYRDHTWAGELEEAFIEVWRQYSNSRYYLIEEGSPLANDDLPGTLGIRISDFYPQDVWQASDIEDGTVPFNSPSFLGGLRFISQIVPTVRVQPAVAPYGDMVTTIVLRHPTFALVDALEMGLSHIPHRDCS
ncbi:hypothetical protein V1504DRAFT_497861 [Lipomyces starkeyi]